MLPFAIASLALETDAEWLYRPETNCPTGDSTAASHARSQFDREGTATRPHLTFAEPRTAGCWKNRPFALRYTERELRLELRSALDAASPLPDPESHRDNGGERLSRLRAALEIRTCGHSRPTSRVGTLRPIPDEPRASRGHQYRQSHRVAAASRRLGHQTEGCTCVQRR